MTPQTLESFRPPGDLQDLDTAKDGRKIWSKQISDWINAEIDGTAGSYGPRHRLKQFFNGMLVPFETEQKPTAITWSGFPLKVRVEQASDDARWAFAEDPRLDLSNPKNGLPLRQDRENMDEYLEWSTLKDKETKDVQIVSFTCEGPEYWEQIGKLVDIDAILDLYKKMNPHFKDDIKLEDIQDCKTKAYNPFNKWNRPVDTGTIAHLIQDNNTLSAEIDIAAQATVIRKDLNRGDVITNINTLCGDASGYGSIKRNSDPVIGGEINTLARQGFQLSVADPIALYMHAADFSSFRLDPTGKRRGNPDDMVDVPNGTFQFLRGDIKKGWGLHLLVSLPEDLRPAPDGRKLNLSDLFDLNNGGQYVRYGSQFADYITMSVSGVVGPNQVKEPPKKDSYAYTEPFQPVPVDLSIKTAAAEAGEGFSALNTKGVEDFISKTDGLGLDKVANAPKVKKMFLNSRI